MPATPMPTTMVARLTETAISRARLGSVALALGLAACGGGGPATSAGPATTASPAKSAFAWLHAVPPPSGWRVAAIPSGATMAYPTRWRRERGDAGTATAVLVGKDRRFIAYLNLTPHQGTETLANWSSFRVDHNADEGDRAIKRLAAARGLHFRTGPGSCIKDSYTTSVGAHYIEIACLVAGPRGQTVIVGAAPPSTWARESGVLERAIEGVRP